MKSKTKIILTTITLLLFGISMFIFILAKEKTDVKNKIDILKKNRQNTSTKNKVLNIIEGIEEETGANDTTLKQLENKGWITILSTSTYSFIDTTIFYLKDKNKHYLLDLVAHGNAPLFCNLDISEIIREINRKCTLDTNTIIYLNGCNTGLYYTALNMSIAQKLANEVNCIVYGARGYLQGTYAQRNERCYKQNTSPSDAYPGAVDTTGDAVWVKCTPDKNANKMAHTDNAYHLNLPQNAANKLSQVLSKQLINTHLIQDSSIAEFGLSMFPDSYFFHDDKRFAFYNNFYTVYDLDKKELYKTDSLFRNEIVRKIKQVK